MFVGREPRCNFSYLLMETTIQDAFSFVSKDYMGDVFGLAAACEIDFLDPEGNVKVELQIQVIGEKVFPPFLERKFRIELFLAFTTDLDNICSTFFEKTKENLKSLVQDKNKGSRFCTFIEESGQISKDQMFWEKQDVIMEALVKHFFVDGAVTSPLLMEILYNGYKPMKVNTPTEEDYESIVTELGCRIVEIFVLDYLFRNKIEVNFTQSELIQTEKKSKKKGEKKAKPKKNDKCVEENKQTLNDESIAADLKEDTSFLNRVRALLNYLFMCALKKHEVIATTLKEKIDELTAEQQEEYVACALKKAVTELYVEAQENVVALYVEVEEESVRRLRITFRNVIRDLLESHNIVEDGNNVSKLYTKTLLTLKPISGYDSLLIELGEYKWTFMVRRMGTSLRFELFADIDNNPMLNFYALNTLAIIHPLDPGRTDCFDRFHLVCKAHPGDVFDLERACENGFLDAEGNVEVEL
ncbi:TNF receptor-associated factor homolog 1b isoform X4 [Medicago truncatula]|uniref:TNF receptor-associated factor homolog 1b isoform X4 n=1 Tax=Medicago truncatula TaxID=3880 RepID=UPI0019689D35|nr:TNF receptor-associated factor homolog 1b isoform X4 [Medicago truncatula]